LRKEPSLEEIKFSAHSEQRIAFVMNMEKYNEDRRKCSIVLFVAGFDREEREPNTRQILLGVLFRREKSARTEI
jgi:hypothetical protein